MVFAETGVGGRILQRDIFFAVLADVGTGPGKLLEDAGTVPGSVCFHVRRRRNGEVLAQQQKKFHETDLLPCVTEGFC